MTSTNSEYRRAVVVSTARRHGWTTSRAALASSCACGAHPGTWCLRRGRAVVGHVHPSRATDDAVTAPGELVSLLDVADLVPSPELVP